MHTSRVTVFALAILSILGFAAIAAQPAIPPSIFFVANEGQWEEPFAFKLSAGGTTVWVTEAGLTLDIRQYDRTASMNRGGRPDRLDALDPMRRDREPEPVSCRGHVLRMSFVNANPYPQLVGQDKLASYSNYFLGRDSCKWRSRVGHYHRVIAENVWTGVDVEFVADANGVKTNYHVHPGADASQIQIEYEGLDAPLQVDDSGNLMLATSLGDLKEQAPWAYQIDGRHQRDVGVQFAVLSNSRYGVVASSVDVSEELVIDPLIYSTYWAGFYWEQIEDMVVDSSACKILSGSTYSVSYPTTPGAYRETTTLAPTGFITKFSPGGFSLVFSTYFPVAGQMEILSDQSIVSVNWTGPNTPLTPDAFDTTFGGGGTDIGITRLSADGSELLFSSYLGGNGLDAAWNVSIDEEHNIYINGSTASSDFPTTENALFPEWNPYVYSYLAVVSLDPPVLLYSTFFQPADAHSVYMAPQSTLSMRDIWVSASTSSDSLPVTGDALHAHVDGVNKSYLAHVDLLDSEFLYASYLWGSGPSYFAGINRIVQINSTRILIVGQSNDSSFTMPPGGYSSYPSGGRHPDMFLLDLQLPSQFLAGTYLGGSNYEGTSMIERRADGAITLVGGSYSDDFPTTADAFDRSHGPGEEEDGSDAVICRLSPDLSQLVYSSFLGGWGHDNVRGSYFDGDDIWLAGNTNAPDFPVTPDALVPVIHPTAFEQGFLTHFRIGDNGVNAPTPFPVPSGLAIGAYPNPFNPSTNLTYTLARPSAVNLSIYDIEGRLVFHAALGNQPAGSHRLQFDGSKLPSGLYFATVQANDARGTAKLLLMR
jgi:hypothetical protein